MKAPITLAIAMLAVTAGSAAAQQAGTYSGTASDGSSISFTIGTDSGNGKLQVQSVNLGLVDTCNPGAFTLNTGWGLGGDGTDLTGNTGTYNFSYGYLYFSATLKFSGTKLTGTALNATPTLIPPTSGSGEPKKAAYCSSKKRGYTATLQPAPTSSDAASRRPQAVIYGTSLVRQ